MAVELREITAETVRAICDLSVRDDQDGFVAHNAVSIAQAHFSEFAWFRAIYSDDEPVGFVMLYDKEGEYFLWRMMVDGRFQGSGYGGRALELVIEYVRTRPNADVFFTSVVPKPNNAQPFYERHGFVATGEQTDDGETLLKLDLTG